MYKPTTDQADLELTRTAAAERKKEAVSSGRPGPCYLSKKFAFFAGLDFTLEIFGIKVFAAWRRRWQLIAWLE